MTRRKMISVLLVLLVFTSFIGYSFAGGSEDLGSIDRLSLDVLYKNGLITEEQYNKIIAEIDAATEIEEGNGTTDEKEEVDISKFDLINIKVLSSNSLKLTFSQPVVFKSNQSRAFKIIKDGKVVSDLNIHNSTFDAINEDPNSLHITLTNGFKLIQGEEYQLGISKLYTSKFGAYYNNYADDSISFKVPFFNYENLKIESVTAVYDDTISIKFNRGVDLESAMRVTNYSINMNDGKLKWMPKSVVPIRNMDGEVDEVYITTKSLTVGKDYAVSCRKILSIDKLTEIDQKNSNFSSVDSNYSKLWVQSAEVKDSTTIYINFNRNINLDESSGYVNFSNNAYMTKMNYGNDKSEIIISLNNIKPLQENKEYSLIVSGFVDELGKKQEYSERISLVTDTVEKAEFKVEEAFMVSDNRMILKFSKEIDSTITDYSPYIKLYYYVNENDKVYKKCTNVKAIEGGYIGLTLSDEAVNHRLSIEIRHVYDISRQHLINYNSLEVN